MSIITRFLTVATEPQFQLARDLTAMAIADGKITQEEREALSIVCNVEKVDETLLLENLQGSSEHKAVEIPQTHKEKEQYLISLIKLIGADKYASPQEVYLLQIIAGKMGLNKMDVVGLILLTSTRRYFEGDTGARVLASFLKNYVDPKGKSEKENRENIRAIYETIANNTERLDDEEADEELLRQNLERATLSLLENKILIKEFDDMALNLARILREEEMRVFKQYTKS